MINEILMNDFENASKCDPVDNSFLLMYHGGILRQRGIEVLIRVVAINPHVCAVILGNGDASYMSTLQSLAQKLGVEKRILFHPAVPISELWKYVGAVDVSVMMIRASAKSYYYALPNKFFESIQALTPIIASDFPEMKKIIEKYEIGLTCDPDDVNAINACVERMRTDKMFYNQCKENLKKAKEDLCWEKEKFILMEAYKKIIG